MVRNWVSFTEMSGDHIVEQHVHNLDVANWYIGRLPKSALGFGGRARRKTGDQFDFFSIDLDYGDGVPNPQHVPTDQWHRRRRSRVLPRHSEGETWGGGTGPRRTRKIDRSRISRIAIPTCRSTGKLVRWSDIMENTNSPYYNVTCKPTPLDFEAGTVVAPPDDIAAVPGRD